MPRFFVEPFSGNFVQLSGEVANHIRVLRLRPGDELTLCNGTGADYRCRLENADGETAFLTVLEQSSSRGEPAVEIRVYMAFAKSDKLEHVIQKATELGVSEIIAYPSMRCVARYDGKTLKSKLPRWQKIAVSAAEQSGRGRIPAVRVLNDWQAVLAEAQQTDLPLFFYERAQDNALHQLAVSRPWRSAAILTGPEGGYTETEAAQAAEAGLLTASLGSRILRCETAPLAALSGLLFAAGEL